MVDLVGDESGDAPFEDGDAAFACDVLVLDVDHERTGDQTAYIEEAQAALVLLIVIFTGFNDLWIEQALLTFPWVVIMLLPGLAGVGRVRRG